MSEETEIEEVEVPPERPTIDVRADALHEVVTEAEDALIAATAPIFQRGMQLVVPVSMKVMAADERETQSPALKAVDVPALRDHLSRAAVFQTTTTTTTKAPT